MVKDWPSLQHPRGHWVESTFPGGKKKVGGWVCCFTEGGEGGGDTGTGRQGGTWSFSEGFFGLEFLFNP